MIRIAIDTTYMDRRPGKGTAIVIRKTIEQMRRFKNEFDITLIHKEPIPEDPLYREFKEIIIPRVPLPKFSGFFSQLWFFLTTRSRFDIFYFSYSRLYPTFWLAPAKRLIWAAMDGGPATSGYIEKAKGKAPWYVRIFLSRITSIIAISKFGKNGIIETYDISPEKVHLVYDGLDHNHFSSIAAPGERQTLITTYGFPERYILDVSRFDPHKNILRLLEAYALFRSRTVSPPSLVFVGGRHMKDYSALVDAKIQELSLQDFVYVAPYIDDAHLPAVYRQAECMVFPSLYEGFGLPVLEAMACGIPVIVSRIPALLEVANGAALTVDPYDVESIAIGLEQGVARSSEIQDLVRRAHERAQQFSWTAHGDAIREVFLNTVKFNTST